MCSCCVAYIGKRKEVMLYSKAGWDDGADEISVDELVWELGSRLRLTIVDLGSFRSLTDVVYGFI